jgi:hypothetical protein
MIVKLVKFDFQGEFIDNRFHGTFTFNIRNGGYGWTMIWDDQVYTYTPCEICLLPCIEEIDRNNRIFVTICEKHGELTNLTFCDDCLDDGICENCMKSKFSKRYEWVFYQ